MSHSTRLLSLDVMRGMTIAGMILVNDPGSWTYVYPALRHAVWHGITPTDLIFPFFLFIMGVSITFSLGKQLQQNKPKPILIRKIAKRAGIIFLLGLFLAGFPYFGGKPENMSGARHIIYLILLIVFLGTMLMKEVASQPEGFRAERQRLWRWAFWGAMAAVFVAGVTHFDISGLRIPGVLQRIAVVFLISALIYLYTGWRAQLYLLGGILLLYWVLMTLVPVPGGYAPNLEKETNLGAWLDRLIFTTDHLWRSAKTWDPEGLLSTLPAVGTGIMGMLSGYLLQARIPKADRTAWLFVGGFAALFIGEAWHLVFPINKALWTSSFVVYTGGLAMMFLGTLYWLIDVKSYQKWTPVWESFGRNPITAYVAAGLLARFLGLVKIGETSLHAWIFEHIFASWLKPHDASLLFALIFVLAIGLPIWVLYKRNIIIKV